MAVQVVWSREALKDVKEIAAYIRRDSPFYARIVTEKILETTRKIQSAPQAAAIIPEIGGLHFRESVLVKREHDGLVDRQWNLASSSRGRPECVNDFETRGLRYLGTFIDRRRERRKAQ